VFVVEVPATKSIVPLLTTPPEPTVTERVELIVRVRELLTVKLRQTAFSETAIFELIITSSVASGTPLGIQLLLVPQFAPVLVFNTGKTW
jgi:hypothetical protein